MKVLVVGSTGALGRPTVSALVAAGHAVHGLTRTESKKGIVSSLGAEPVLGDAMDPSSIDRVIGEVRPNAVIQLLNALPKRGPMRPSDIDATNELRRVGTRHVLDASLRHDVRRFIVESMIFGYGYGNKAGVRTTEDDQFGRPIGDPHLDPALDALRVMERMVLEASDAGDIDGVVLRFGLFYGPDVGSSEFMRSLLRKRLMFLPGGGGGRVSWIHVEDGAAAIVAALEKASAGAIYNVVDNEPASVRDLAGEMARYLGVRGPRSIPVFLAKIASSYAAKMAGTTLRVSNQRIKEELGWTPRFPTYREGVSEMERAEAAG